MPETKFRAFLSCSFSQEDERIVEFFKGYCESFVFEILKYDFQEPVGLTEGIKTHIRNSDCVIAVATRRNKIEESGEYICPEWIEHEIVFAAALGKPVILFVEEGVRIAGLVARDERFQRFARGESELLRQVPQFNKFLMGVRSLLEHQLKAGADSTPVLFRHSIRSREEVLSAEACVMTCEVEMESVTEGLKQCHHGFGSVDWTRPAQEALKDFEFSIIQAPPNVSVSYELGRRKEDPTHWHIIFTPPLSIGDRVKYAFRYVGERVKPFTLEDAEEAIAAGIFWCDQPRCGQNWLIVHPTGELTSEVLFPSKYPIHEPDFSVEVGETRMAVPEEKERIRQAGGFRVQRFFDRCTLTLMVTRPVRGHEYTLTWRPPKRAELG